MAAAVPRRRLKGDGSMFPRQLVASLVIGVLMLILIVRLVQRGYLDIAYCWLWLVVGLGICGIVLKYEWLVQLSDLIGSKTPTTTLFLLAFVILLLLCLQFSMVISTHRRQIKRLTQQLAILEERATLPEDRAPRQLDTGS
jgi:hypothetical protein